METDCNGLNLLPHNNNRPRFLNLWQIRLPVTGWASILHRLSGVLLFLLLPLPLYMLQLSLSGTEGFHRATLIANSLPARLVVLLLLWSLAHHLFAGIRVLLIDMEWGSGLAAARRSARLVVGLALFVLLCGVMV